MLKLLNLFKNKLDKTISGIPDLVARFMINNVKNGKDVNDRNLRRNKKKSNPPLKDTKKLLNSIRATKNSVSLKNYGKILNNGTKNIKKREFIPFNTSSKQYKKMLKLIKEKVMK